MDGGDLRPSKQCVTAARNANFALGQLQRAFHYRKKEFLIPFYKTFVSRRVESSRRVVGGSMESMV